MPHMNRPDELDVVKWIEYGGQQQSALWFAPQTNAHICRVWLWLVEEESMYYVIQEMATFL